MWLDTNRDSEEDGGRGGGGRELGHLKVIGRRSGAASILWVAISNITSVSWSSVSGSIAQRSFTESLLCCESMLQIKA